MDRTLTLGGASHDTYFQSLKSRVPQVEACFWQQRYRQWFPIKAQRAVKLSSLPRESFCTTWRMRVSHNWLHTKAIWRALSISLSLSILTADLGILISLQQQWQVKLDRNTQYHSIENVIYHTVVQDKPQQWRNSGVARTHRTRIGGWAGLQNLYLSRSLC